MIESNLDSIDPANDPRTVDDLVNAALSEPEDSAWNAVCALHWRGTAEVLHRAVELCRSECPQERTLAADILGQLGVPDRTFPELSIKVLLSILNREDDPSVLASVFIACSHNHDQAIISPAVNFATHPDPEVRHAVVLALTGYDDQTAIGTLIALSRDPDDYVRDWATFALGTQLDVDSHDIRSALVDRLNDADIDTRYEAIVGLARRGDQRVVATLAKELSAQEVDSRALEAAELIRAPELEPQLIAMRAGGNS